MLGIVGLLGVVLSQQDGADSVYPFVSCWVVRGEVVPKVPR